MVGTRGGIRCRSDSDLDPPAEAQVSPGLSLLMDCRGMDVTVGPTVVLYSRHGCHLCEDVRAQLETLRGEHGFELMEVDIDLDPELKQQYDHDVPVVTVDGREAFRHHWSPRRFLERIRAQRGAG